MERLPRWLGDGWVLMEWIMMLMGLGVGIVLIEMEKPGGMNAGLFAGGDGSGYGSGDGSDQSGPRHCFMTLWGAELRGMDTGWRR